jgi:hypothetical protein
LAAVHVAPERLQVPLSVGHLLDAFADVHAVPVLMLQWPMLGQLVDAFAVVHDVAVSMLQWPLIGVQTVPALAAVQAVPVLTEQLPLDGHCVAALAGWQAMPVLLQVPLMSGHWAADVQTVPVLMLQWPADAQVALVRHDVPVRLQLPGMVVHTAAAFAAVQLAPLTVHLPAVVHVGGGHVVLSVHEISGLAGLQPSGLYVVVQELGGGSTQVVVMLSQVWGLTLLQTCAVVLQLCVWKPLQDCAWMLLQDCVW